MEVHETLDLEEKINQWWSELQRERKCNSTSAIAKIVNKCSFEEQEHVRTLISNCIKRSISDSIQCEDITRMNHVCNAINGCFDNFTHATDAANISFSEIINFIDVCSDICTNELFIKHCSQCNMVKILDLLHCLSRILVLVLKLRRPAKCEQNHFHLPEIKLFAKEMLAKLSNKLGKLLKVNEISMDTKCNFAMASLLIREVLIEEKEKLVQYHKNFLASLPNNINEKEYDLNVLRFIFSNAVLNTWSSTVIDASSTGIYLRFFIQLCESYSSDTAFILNISRALLLLVKNECFKEFMMNLHEENFSLINSLLSCAYMLLDHPVPCVRHSSKDFLRLLAVYEKFKLSMLKSLSTLHCDKRSYFICLAALADEAGSQSLLDTDQDLPKNLIMALHDPTLVTYVINAIDSIIVKDRLIEKNFSQWCERWIVPLLVSLSKVPLAVSADIEKLLDGLFMRYPSAVFYIIEKWFDPKNDEELRYIMTALKIYHKHGFKKQININVEVNMNSSSDLEEKKWKDLISEKLLRFCIHHNDDDIRVSAFSLIIQGLKSTEVYTEQDFDLIKYSLTCNLNNQHPATRQKFLSLIKKMLARYADSLAVLKRNEKCRSHSVDVSGDIANYARFKEWLFNFCLSNIFDGANFSRLNTILSLLLICLENIGDVTTDHSLIDVYWRKILVPLRSSYEENKIMAVTLAKKLNILKLLNDSDTIKLMFKRAHKLCGKIEPPNVLTGAYLMKVLIEHPLTKKVVEEYLSEDTSGSSSELMCIQLLSKKLEEQIHSAEKSLIRAAMTGPMYGTLFTIRIILQEIDFLKLNENDKSGSGADLKKTWSLVLKNLIELSFRMIHVVNCVVNSSSPEGHLPSDFQSDFEYMMMNQFNLPRIVVEENWVEENLNAGSLRIQNMTLDDLRPIRPSADILNDCEKFIKRYNKVFLSHGDSCSYSRKNALHFNGLLTVCTQLISEIQNIHVNEVISEFESNRAYEFLTCLCKIENQLEDCINIYKEYSYRRDRPTAQVLLLCSWRSIKEACLFLGDLVSKLPLEQLLELGLLTEEIVITVGEELQTLLCEIKHRGAFEHAYVGFSQLIMAFWKCPRKNLSELPKKWLEEILSEIKLPAEKQKLKLCSSRRSAGLPFLVQAIISSELQCTNSAKIKTLDLTMSSLLASVEGKESVSLECEIHALNILRALFKHAMFGEHVAPYISRGLMIAIKGSRSAVWSVRNSSSLLFSSLIVRIFGVARNKDALSKKNRMTGRHFFQRYPELYEFFLNEMKLAFQDDLQSHVYNPQPHVFHMLLILGRLYPPPTEDPLSIDFSEFLPFIDTSCCNSALKIRELGAKALIPLIGSDSFIEELDMRFSFLKSEDIDSNHIHGILLQVKTILTEMWEKTILVKESIEKRGGDWIQGTESILNVGEKPAPYLIKICYIQILHIFFKICVSLRKQINELLTRKELLDDINKSSEIEKSIPGRFAYLETLCYVKFDIAAHIMLDNGNSYDLMQLIMSMLTSEIDEVQAVALTFLQYITSERYEDTAEEQDANANLITVRIKDLSCIQSEKDLEIIKSEILSQSIIHQYVVQCFLSLLADVKISIFSHKTITSLKISVTSTFLFQNIISIRNIYDSCNTTKRMSYSILDSLSYLVECENSDVSVGGFICYSVFFFENVEQNVADVVSGSFSYFRKLLFTFSDPDADVKQRTAVSEIFNRYYYFFNHDLFKKDSKALSIWMLPLRLMNDEDPAVRRTAMELVSKYQKYFMENNQRKKLNRESDVSLSQLTTIPSKAQETLLDFYISLLDGDDLLNLIVQMVVFSMTAYINTINYEHKIKQNEEGVFERGNPNPFCEELIFAKLLCGKLQELKTLIDVKSFFKKKLDSTHIAYLRGFFPTVIFPHFPETLHELCIQIISILSEEDTKHDLKNLSCLPFYVSELTEAFDF